MVLMVLADVSQNVMMARELLSERAELKYIQEDLIVTAEYVDELSAHRAGNIWKDILLRVYLLEVDSDYRMKVQNVEKLFVLECTFTSSCGQYAFWRLSHNQASHIEEELSRAHYAHLRAEAYPNNFTVEGVLSKDQMMNLSTVQALDSVSDKIKSAVDSISHLVNSFLKR